MHSARRLFVRREWNPARLFEKHAGLNDNDTRVFAVQPSRSETKFESHTREQGYGHVVAELAQQIEGPRQLLRTQGMQRF